MKTLKAFLINLQFFTSIPLRLELPVDNRHLSRAIATFPLLGLFQGLLQATLLYLLIEWTPFSMLVITFFMIIFTIFFTGGLHLDGFIDTSDAFFSYRNPEKRLEIMSDPRVGAFGVLSVIVLLSGRFLFTYEVITEIQQIYFIVIVIPVLSKSVMGLSLTKIKTAKQSGLAHFFQKSVNKFTLSIYFIYFFGLLFGSAIISFSFLWYILILTSLTILVYIYFRIKVVQWFGGITGDVVGALVEGVEFILWMAVFVLHYFVTV